MSILSDSYEILLNCQKIQIQNFIDILLKSNCSKIEKILKKN